MAKKVPAERFDPIEIGSSDAIMLRPIPASALGFLAFFLLAFDGPRPAIAGEALARIDGAWRIDMLRRINAIRRSEGLGGLRMDERLNRAAQLHSDDMVKRDFFDHESPDGARMTDRAEAFGYRWRRLLENIAAGQRDFAAAIEGWMRSPGHRAAILDAQIRDAGMGYTFVPKDSGAVNKSHYWTLLVGME